MQDTRIDLVYRNILSYNFGIAVMNILSFHWTNDDKSNNPWFRYHPRKKVNYITIPVSSYLREYLLIIY